MAASGAAICLGSRSDQREELVEPGVDGAAIEHEQPVEAEPLTREAREHGARHSRRMEGRRLRPHVSTRSCGAPDRHDRGQLHRHDDVETMDDVRAIRVVDEDIESVDYNGNGDAEGRRYQP